MSRVLMLILPHRTANFQYTEAVICCRLQPKTEVEKMIHVRNMVWLMLTPIATALACWAILEIVL